MGGIEQWCSPCLAFRLRTVLVHGAKESCPQTNSQFRGQKLRQLVSVSVDEDLRRPQELKCCSAA